MSKKSTARLDMVDMVPMAMLTCGNGASWKSRGATTTTTATMTDSDGAITTDWVGNESRRYHCPQ